MALPEVGLVLREAFGVEAKDFDWLGYGKLQAAVQGMGLPWLRTGDDAPDAAATAEPVVARVLDSAAAAAIELRGEAESIIRSHRGSQRRAGGDV